MRIIAGEATGRTLRAPHGKSTRPTDSRTREMLFNILGEEVIGARVLDLYAGSGAVGIEALSRGADSCVFVEQNAAAANVIRDNLKSLKWEDQGTVWQASLRSALHRMSQGNDHKARYDLIFADPPFHAPQEFVDLIQRVDILSDLLHNVGVFAEGYSGLLVIQHPQRLNLPFAQPLTLWKSRRAGESCLSFFRLNYKD